MVISHLDGHGSLPFLTDDDIVNCTPGIFPGAEHMAIGHDVICRRLGNPFGRIRVLCKTQHEISD